MHPVEALAAAIAKQEGWLTPGKLPTIRNNPGDLRFAGQLGATRPDGTTTGHLPTEPIAQFATPEAGITALYRQIWAQVAQGQTVAQIIAQWAPPTENDTSTYLANVLAWTKLPKDTPVLRLLPPLPKI